jgi:hypothetical protein
MAILLLTMAALGIRAGQPERDYIKKWLADQLQPDHRDEH